ncbi:hypothetical protein [Phenylobacterium soli]|uniref:Glycosyltransferase RgtA/B/C/D-like domain-containing protein n=1 Tax=Phenylobacterium soli TaxID=2170551 RepID=A0A328ARJ7_9CAUL|nr:hypothetical protein [Phenylobacterium soli]RAK55568.1 hypothetical protein DJ017_14145 [Phenylobacterium soli]
MTATVQTVAAQVQGRVQRLGDAFASLSPAQVIAAVFAFAVVLIPGSVFNDPDTFWHIAAGRWMIEHRAVLKTDVFSYTWAGKPWASHEWLAEIVMAAAYMAGGWTGVMLLFAASLGLAAWLLAGGIGRWMGPLGQAVALTLALFVIAPTVLARPHLLMLPILVAWTREMLAAREAHRAPRWWFALFMLAWANLHGSFVFGFVLAGGFGLEALVARGADRLKVIRDWGIFGALCILAALATPHGISGLIAPFDIMFMGTLDQIIEWKPANFSKFTPFEGAILVTLLICLAKGVRVPLVRAVLMLFIFHMALQHQRHQLVVAVIMPLLLAEPIGRAFNRQPGSVAMTRAGSIMLAVLALGFAGWRIADPAVRKDDGITPVSALAHVPPELAARPVFNAYNFGGYLIFKGVKVFIDGRADMYGDAYVKRYSQANKGDAATIDKLFKQYDIAWVITQPKEGVVEVVSKRPGWKKIYGDKYAVVLAREDALPKAAGPAPQAKPQPKP